MPPKRSAPAEDEVDFLLCCLDSLDGSVKWNEVATKMGRFKSGATANQYYKRMKTRYAGQVPGAAGVSSSSASTPPKPSKGGIKKRGGKEESDDDSDDEGDEKEEEKPKPKQAKKPKMRMPVVKTQEEDEESDEEGESAQGERPTMATKRKRLTSKRPRREFEAEAWDRAVRNVASRATSDLFTSASYTGRTEPMVYFDDKEKRLKLFDRINGNIKDL